MATEYDLGEITITQTQLDESSEFREMLVALRGVVAVPEGDGPFPVALVVHGSYRFCDAPLVDGEVDRYPCPPENDLQQYEGFGYLAEALADAGYVSLVPDLSAEFNNGFGFSPPGDRAIRIIESAAEDQRGQIAAFLPGFFDLALEHVEASRSSRLRLSHRWSSACGPRPKTSRRNSSSLVPKSRRPPVHTDEGSVRVRGGSGGRCHRS